MDCPEMYPRCSKGCQRTPHRKNLQIDFSISTVFGCGVKLDLWGTSLCPVFQGTKEREMAVTKPILVQKYGGSSVADPEKLKQVAQRVVSAKLQGYRVVVVVSAMGNTTDRFMQMARDMTQQPHRRELDMLLSAGERISMALLSMAIQNLGHESISFTGSQSGILTNDRHFDAHIIEVRPVRIQDELEQDKIVIVAGFQGMSYKREVTTLGRGGSDTTAVALAAALGAEACEICSDVDGVYTADPRVVPEAKHIANLSHEEMETLARSGAKVLHADAVAWARQHQVALYARATAAPFGTPGGTLIRRDHDVETESLLRPAITCMNFLHHLQIQVEPARFLEIAHWWTQARLVPIWSHWTTQGVEAFFRRDDADLLSAALSNTPSLLSVQLHHQTMACVSLVGRGLARDPQWLALGIRVLQESTPAVPIHAIDTESLRASFFVPSSCQEQAQQQLHRAVHG